MTSLMQGAFFSLAFPTGGGHVPRVHEMPRFFSPLISGVRAFLVVTLSRAQPSAVRTYLQERRIYLWWRICTAQL